MGNVTTSVLISGISLRNGTCDINEYMRLENVTFRSRLYVRLETDVRFDVQPYECNPLLLLKAMQLALPTVTLTVHRDSKDNTSEVFEVLNEFASSIINVYTGNSDEIRQDNGEHIIIEDNLVEHIKKCRNIMCEHNEINKQNKLNGTWKATRWQHAFNGYMSSLSAYTLDASILNLISGLECLLVEGEGSLSHKVSINASLIYSNNSDERRNAYKLLKLMYNCRSKIVHGEVKAFVKILSKPDIFTQYYKLKDIYASVLISTFNVPEDKVFSELDNVIFESRALQFK